MRPSESLARLRPGPPGAVNSFIGFPVARKVHECNGDSSSTTHSLRGCRQCGSRTVNYYEHVYQADEKMTKRAVTEAVWLYSRSGSRSQDEILVEGRLANEPAPRFRSYRVGFFGNVTWHGRLPERRGRAELHGCAYFFGTCPRILSCYEPRELFQRASACHATFPSAGDSVQLEAGSCYAMETGRSAGLSDFD